ncbi:MAG: DUF5329 domain-containing protein [Dokdonella sp.]
MKRTLRCLLMLAIAVSAGTHAEPDATTTRAEITALLHALGTSQCEFFRNGTWYDSAKAEDHLKRKLDYFERKGLISTSDTFIDDAASRSSMSGKPYQVRCQGQPAQPSADWLKGKLEELRKGGLDSTQ